MTTERWNDQMLDQLASLAKENANSIANLTHDVANLTNQVTNMTSERSRLSNEGSNLSSDINPELTPTQKILEDNKRIMEVLANYSIESAKKREERAKYIAQQQEEIVRLRIECQRKLDILSNQQKGEQDN